MFNENVKPFFKLFSFNFLYSLKVKGYSITVDGFKLREVLVYLVGALVYFGGF